MKETKMLDTTYTTIVEWESYEGGAIGYNDYSDQVIDIEALQDRTKCAKWAEIYKPGRDWSVTHEDGTITLGHSKDLRAAKKDAIAALAAGGAR